jgi:hypothetical protein
MPANIRAAVTDQTGPVTAAHDIPDGYNCLAAVVLDTPAGQVFVKATGPDGSALREASLSPVVTGIGPRFRWFVAVDGWHITGHDALPAARHTQLGPDSGDLPLLADLLARAARIPAPAHLPAWADQWTGHATPAELAHLHGDTLIHGDINEHNALISGGRAWLVDWDTASSGPAWVDTAEAVVRAMEDGCGAEEAQGFAEAVPAWRAAAPAAIRAWADVRCRAFTVAIGAHDARHFVGRHQAMVAAHGRSVHATV